jgi:hypothetical protein
LVKVFQEFLEAANELDELSLEGYFGESVKQATQRRETISVDQHLYESLKLWIDGEKQTHHEDVKEYIILFFYLYLEAFKEGKQEAIDVMSSFWLGTKDNPEMECMSSYGEFARLFTRTKNILIEKRFEKLSDKKNFADSLSNTYSKGVELIGKTLTICIILQMIIKKETYSYYKIYNMTLFDKLESFKNNDTKNYKKLITVVNRNLRNAEAHLSLRFIPKTNEYILKKKFNGKIITDKIPIETMIMELFLGVGAYIQAFIYSGILFTLAHNNKELFVKSIREIYE